MATTTLTVILGAIGATSCARSEPPERDFRTQLASNYASFESLRALVNRRPRIAYLTFVQGSIVTELPNGAVVPIDSHDRRMLEVARLMRSTGTETLTNVDGEFELILWRDSQGLRGNDVKGLAFSDHPVGPVVASVDEKTRDRYFRAGAHEIFSAVGRKWYVFFRIGN